MLQHCWKMRKQGKKTPIVAGKGCDCDRRGVEEDELSAEELLVRAEAEDVDAKGYLHRRGEPVELLLRCGLWCRTGPESSDPRMRTALAIGALRRKGLLLRKKRGRVEDDDSECCGWLQPSVTRWGSGSSRVGTVAVAEEGVVGQHQHCCAHPRSIAAANKNVVVEAGAGGSRRLRSSSRGPQLRLKKKATAMAKEETRVSCSAWLITSRILPEVDFVDRLGSSRSAAPRDGSPAELWCNGRGDLKDSRVQTQGLRSLAI
ncbi:hypothetical protein BHM03_00044751 [Ensete ventricosum]|nr:hypothetical protein BHM03_00044751 [Ensete ventricosum]